MCEVISGARVNVLMQLLGAQRQVRLHEDAIEPVWPEADLGLTEMKTAREQV